MQRRIKNNLDPPPYVSKIQDLSYHLLSWDSKGSSTTIVVNERPRSSSLVGSLKPIDNGDLRPGSQHTYPKVNIIGCLHPIELILAKADDRLRKQNSTNEQKKHLCEGKSKEITQKINSETHHEVNFQLKQQQFAWVKISLVAMYMSKLHIVFTDFRVHLHRINIVFTSSVKIQNMMRRWFTRHQFRKYRLSIFKMLGANAFIFKMTLRIYLKRRAVMKVITFLKEQESNSKVSIFTMIMHTA